MTIDRMDLENAYKFFRTNVLNTFIYFQIIGERFKYM